MPTKKQNNSVKKSICRQCGLPIKMVAVLMGMISMTTHTIADDTRTETTGFAAALENYFISIPVLSDPETDIRYVPSEVNGVASLMLIDSGATSTVYSKNFAKKNKIKLKKHGVAHGAAGEVTSYKGDISSVSLGGVITFSQPLNLFIDLHTDSEITLNKKEYQLAGNLGYNMLSKLDLNFDVNKNQILMPDPDTDIEGGLWALLKQIDYQKVDLKKTKKACYLSVTIGDKKGYFKVDTGSSQTILFDKFTMGKDYKLVQEGGFVEAVGNKKIPIKMMMVDDFRFANLRINVPMLVVPQEISMIDEKPVMGVIGIGALGQLNAVVNFKKAAIYLPKHK